jgi:uncharacterized membrane protein required for colicin V production
VALVLVFALRGVARGTVRQVFSFLGIVGGVWTALLVSRWVGAHWAAARPEWVFGLLRWTVAVLAGLAVSSLLAWWGELLAGAVRETPIGWVDRAGGFFVGASLGTLVVSFVLLIALLVPWPRQAASWAAAAQLSSPILAGAARACELGTRFVPASSWLRNHFRSAARRVRAASPPS